MTTIGRGRDGRGHACASSVVMWRRARHRMRRGASAPRYPTSCHQHSAVDRIRLTGDERRFIRTEIQGERRYFFGCAHAPDRLVGFQRPPHFVLPTRIVLAEVAFYERR